MGRLVEILPQTDPRTYQLLETLTGPADRRLLTVDQVYDVRTAEPGNGAADQIWGGAGRDRLLGGNGSDEIWGGTEVDVIFGDQGHMGYRSADYFGTADMDLTTLDVIESVDTAAAYGAGDIIHDDASDDIIIGGQGGVV